MTAKGHTKQSNHFLKEEIKVMAVKIRLKRRREKKVRRYRMVVAEASTPRSGRAIEEIGTYNPNTDPAEVKVDAEAAKKWIANGAQPTTVVKKLFKQAGVK